MVAFTDHTSAELVTKSGLVDALSPFERSKLLRNQVLPAASLARGRRCMMCSDRYGSSRVLPCCLFENWCHVNCSYQSRLGRICPSHARILDPKREITILPHPYLEDYAILPTRHPVRTSLGQKRTETAQASRQSGQQFLLHAGVALRWLVNGLVEKHAWLIWTIDSADTGQKAIAQTTIKRRL